jgi:hypothetical protein
LVKNLLGLCVPKNHSLVLSSRTNQTIVWRKISCFNPVLMTSQGKIKLCVLDSMHFDSLIIRTRENQFTVIAIIQSSDWSVVRLDGEGVSFRIVCPDLNRLVLRSTG